MNEKGPVNFRFQVWKFFVLIPCRLGFHSDNYLTTYTGGILGKWEECQFCGKKWKLDNAK